MNGLKRLDALIQIPVTKNLRRTLRREAKSKKITLAAYVRDIISKRNTQEVVTKSINYERYDEIDKRIARIIPNEILHKDLLAILSFEKKMSVIDKRMKRYGWERFDHVWRRKDGW